MEGDGRLALQDLPDSANCPADEWNANYQINKPMRKTYTMSQTDKELFRDYLMSKEEGKADTVGTLYLTGHECFGIDAMLRNVMNSIINPTADPQPIEELDFLMGELRGLLHNLAHVREGFLAFKGA